MGKTKIEWATDTWNPITGCTPISEGCANCYAARMAKRLKAMGQPKYKDGFAVRFHPETLNQPLRWRKPRDIFVCSMGDLFHNNCEFPWVWRVFGTMMQARQHRYLILTKRPAAMRAFVNGYLNGDKRHIWFGASVENQRWLDQRLPSLQACETHNRFLSLEPLLGPVDLKWNDLCHNRIGQLSWVIVGGETGPAARPMNPDWARAIRDQCAAARVPFFFKHMAKNAPIPPDLQVREFPWADLRLEGK